MFPQKPASAGAVQPELASDRRKRRKGNGRTELSRRELEQMLFDVARLRAANARSRSRA